MAGKIGGKSQTTNTSQSGTASGSMSSVSNPWAATTPYLEDFLSRLRTASTGAGTVTPGQSAAYGAIASNADRTAQFTPDIEALTRDLFRTESTSPMATDAYRRLEGQIGATASGAGVNPMDDPSFKALIDSVGADAMNRINSMFAGAGRDLSPENSAAITRAVTSATAPILVDQFNRNIDRQTSAASALYGAGTETARTTDALDASAMERRTQGIQTATAALDALNLPAQTRLQIEEQLKRLPIEELGTVAQQLFAAAGLGGSTSGTQTQQQRMTGTSKTSGSEWGLGFKYPSIG